LPLNGGITSGQLLLKGRDLRHLNDETMRRIRGSEMSMIFQDPMNSLNPVYSIEQQMVMSFWPIPPMVAHGEEGSK
jgi:ABC-type dipeptide/oligopeptide/nickel transport system ATPase component